MRACLVIFVAVASAACARDRSSELEHLAALRSEAQAANRARAAEAEQDPRTHPPETLDAWKLDVFGPAGEVAELDGRALDALATSEVVTISPQRSFFPDKPVRFRTIRIRSLLEQFFPGVTWPDGETITFLCYDGFRVPVALRDVLDYPIGLAVARDGELLRRSGCGPLYLVFPHTQYPELVDRYPDGSWAFYVTSMFVGTAPPHLHVVGGRDLDESALRALPRRTLVRPVRYKLGWPAGEVRLTGVALRDALDAAGVHLRRGREVIVRGAAAAQRNPLAPRILLSDHVLDGDILLALSWGDADTPIAAQSGGPITLAFPHALDGAYGKRYWLTFLDEVEVIP
jgi:hypothetical protein